MQWCSIQSKSRYKVEEILEAKLGIKKVRRSQKITWLKIRKKSLKGQEVALQQSNLKLKSSKTIRHRHKKRSLVKKVHSETMITDLRPPDPWFKLKVTVLNREPKQISSRWTGEEQAQKFITNFWVTSERALSLIRRTLATIRSRTRLGSIRWQKCKPLLAWTICLPLKSCLAAVHTPKIQNFKTWLRTKM